MLSALIWIPVLGAAHGFWPGSLNLSRSLTFALVVTGITLIWTVVLGSQFEPGNRVTTPGASPD